MAIHKPEGPDANPPVSRTSWLLKLQVILEDVAAKKPSTKEDAIELQDKMKSLTQNMEPETGTSFFVEAYFREFNQEWGPCINQIEALPTSFQITGWERFKKLATKIQKEAKKAAIDAAKAAKRQLTLFPEE